MTNSSNPDLPVDFGDALTASVAGNHDALAHLPADERRIAELLAPFLDAGKQAHLDALAVHNSPALDQDPVAIALGLVAGPEDVIAGQKFKIARLHAGLDVTGVTAKLVARGWPTTAREVFNWQQQGGPIAPALLSALADILATTPDALRASSTARRSPAQDFLQDETIESVLQQWAGEVHRPIDAVRSDVARRLAALSYRNESGATRDAVLAVITALRQIDDQRSSQP